MLYIFYDNKNIEKQISSPFPQKQLFHKICHIRLKFTSILKVIFRNVICRNPLPLASLLIVHLRSLKTRHRELNLALGSVAYPLRALVEGIPFNPQVENFAEWVSWLPALATRTKEQKLKEETTSAPRATALDLALLPRWLWAVTVENLTQRRQWDTGLGSAQTHTGLSRNFLIASGCCANGNGQGSPQLLHKFPRLRKVHPAGCKGTLRTPRPSWKSYTI